MSRIISLEAHKCKVAARRGFREWRRFFQSLTDFDEHTTWADLPEEVLLFLCEESEASKLSFYDLLMGSHRLGNGREFEALPADKLVTLLNVYFLITDQARFECMRRLGWVEEVPHRDKSIIELVLDPESFEYAAQLETPKPTVQHPAYEENLRGKGIDRAALVRRHIPEAIRRFRERASGGSSVVSVVKDPATLSP